LHRTHPDRTDVRLPRREQDPFFPPAQYGPATNPTGLVAGWIELSSGFLIAFGFLTRLAAFLASGEMAVAYFLTSFSGRTLRHGPTILERVFPILNGGEMAVVYCLVFFFIVFYGPGGWSIDFLLKKRSNQSLEPPAHCVSPKIEK